MDTDDLQEVLITRTDDGTDDGTDDDTDTSKDDKPGPSSSRPRTGESGPYDRFRNPDEIEEESKRKCGSDENRHQMKSIRGAVMGEADSDQCISIPSVSGMVQHPTSPSTMEDGMPFMYPRDADVLPTAILMTCCCPICGCIAIILAKKARRLRQAGKFHASAEATEASTWWAWSAALCGCFMLLGLALSVMVFLIMMYI